MINHFQTFNDRCDSFLLAGLACLLISTTPSALIAEDWPTFMGPTRDGVSQEKNLLHAWKAGGPPLLWQKQVGDGFSGPVIAKNRLILLSRKGDKEIIDCFDASSGKPLWTTSYPCSYQDQYNKGDGPRSTPSIVGNQVITLGVEGWLQCTNMENGKKIWGRSICEDYQVPTNFFGVGTSPLVEGNHVLVNVGGKNKAGIVAFDLATGKEVWKSTTDGASYSSPVLGELNGKKVAVFFTRQGVVLLDPQKGEVIHQQPWKARNIASVNAATPLVIGDLLFFSASYETGALLLKAEKSKIKEIWKSQEVMSNHYNTCLHHQGYLYGIDGRQEGRPQLRCIELKTGKIMWTKEDFGCASMIIAGEIIICLTEGGELILFAATPKHYEELAKAEVFENLPCRAEIALANGRLYARDNNMLKCWDLKKK